MNVMDYMDLYNWTLIPFLSFLSLSSLSSLSSFCFLLRSSVFQSPITFSFIPRFSFSFLFACSLFFSSSTLISAEHKPDYTLDIPMRDGALLPMDFYLPEPNARNLPCVLIRSPGGRASRTAVGFTYLTKFGYLVAIQDTRCSLDQAGRTLPYCTDGWGFHQDGYDTVQWLAESEFTNGKIGTVGASALGITQLMMAPTAPVGLKCQYIGMAPSSLFQDGVFVGGQFLKHQVEGWLGLYARDPQLLQFIRTNSHYNAFWKNLDTSTVAHLVNTPAMFYGGWYDVFLQGTLDAFSNRNEKGGERARGKQKIIIGPWPHIWPWTTKLGDFPIPVAAQLPPKEFLHERWLDFHLKDEKNGIDQLPSITYYVMGPFDGSPSKGNVWKTAEKWPIPAAIHPFYLTYDYTLSLQAPVTKTQLAYRSDPNNPIPTVGGRNLFLETGAKDQRLIEQRSDMVVFTSEPLKEDLEITGRIIAKIYLSSNRLETDLVVRLTDLYPDGKSILITDGIKRVCALDKFSKMAPCQVEVDLWSTSIVFAKGHSIRVSISSSNYPKFERNFNGGKEPLIADNWIHLGGDYPSHILLPIP